MDVFEEYGYVWLPYAIAAFLLAGLAFWDLRYTRRAGAIRLSRLLALRVGILGVLAAMAAALADSVVDGDGLTVIDQPIWQFAVDHRTPALTVFFRVVTTVGSTVSMGILATAAVLYLAYRRRTEDAILVAAVSVGAGLIVRLGKASVGRERPPEAYRLATESTESFPSGHALASLAILSVLALLVGRTLQSERARLALRIGVGVVIVLIGVSRIYLGVHWATDVLGGWVSGTAWLVLCLTVRMVVRDWRARSPGTVEPGK